LNAVGTSPLPSTAIPGIYSVYAQGQNGACPSPNRSAALVIVNALPNVNAGVDQTICVGSSVTLTGSGASTYNWTNSVSNGVAFSPSSTVTYTVTGTDANNCSNTDQVIVTVNALPIVNAGVDTSICIGQSIALNATGASTYLWSNGVTNNVAFAPNVTAIYAVNGTDVNGCSNADSVTVTVNALPTIFAGLDTTVCEGSSLTLFGTGGVSYTWNNGIQDSVAFVVAANNIYTVTGTDNNGCQNTDDVAVSTYALPVVNAGSDFSACDNSQVLLSGSGAVSYTWNNSVTDSVPFILNGTTTFVVTGVDLNGCENSDSVTVTANALPSVNAGLDVSQCGDQNVTLTATGAVSYAWTNGVNNGVSFASPIGTTIYGVTGTDSLGCQGADSVSVSIFEIPVATATLTNAVTIDAGVMANATYQWIDCATNQPIANATSSTFNATANGTYAVIVTGAGDCADTSDCVTINEVGLFDLGVDFGLQIYPNPTMDNFFVNFSKFETLSLRILDMQGKLVLDSLSINSGDVLDVSKFERGVYSIEFTFENGQVLTRRLIKN